MIAARVVGESGGRAGDYLDSALAQFAGLARDARTISRDFRVTGLALRLEIAKGYLEQAICRGIAHLEVESQADPDLTIAVWDSEGTGLPALQPAWSVADYGKFGMIDGFNDARYHTVAQFDPVVSVRVLDRDARRAIYWTRAARELPYWEIGAPLRPLLHEWLRGRGRLPVHGGAVGTAEGGVLLAGAGGSGKSNVALACLESELLYASDDFSVLSEDAGWRVHSLY